MARSGPDLVAVRLTGATQPNGQPYVAVVDAADLPLIQGVTWHANIPKGGRTVYARGWKDGKKVQMHRLLSGGVRVDHADGNGLHNWRLNLRPSSASGNACNIPKRRKPASSRYKGVYFCKHRQMFHVCVTVEGKRQHVGYFVLEDEAGRAYDAEAKRLHGKFARLNFPESEAA